MVKYFCCTSRGLVEQYFRAQVAPVPQCVCGFYVTRACLLVKRLNNQLTAFHIVIVIIYVSLCDIIHHTYFGNLYNCVLLLCLFLILTTTKTRQAVNETSLLRKLCTMV